MDWNRLGQYQWRTLPGGVAQVDRRESGKIATCATASLNLRHSWSNCASTKRPSSPITMSIIHAQGGKESGTVLF